jgi:hypothetical protein
MEIRELNWLPLPADYIEEVSSYPDLEDAVLVQATAFSVKLEDLRFIDNEDTPDLYEALCDMSTGDGSNIPNACCPITWGEIQGIKVLFANEGGYGTITTTRQILENL